VGVRCLASELIEDVFGKLSCYRFLNVSFWSGSVIQSILIGSEKQWLN